MENQGENFAIICCYSVEEATFLGQAFDALGRKWSDGYAYANSSTEVLEGSSCVGYSNEGTFYFNPKFGSDVVMMDEYDLNTEGHKFYDFAKIDFTGVLSSEVIDQIEKYLDEKNLKRV